MCLPFSGRTASWIEPNSSFKALSGGVSFDVMVPHLQRTISMKFSVAYVDAMMLDTFSMFITSRWMLV